VSATCTINYLKTTSAPDEPINSAVSGCARRGTRWRALLATSKLDACYTNSARLLVRTLDQRPSVDSLNVALSNPI
jgi:hypothetical protein